MKASISAWNENRRKQLKDSYEGKDLSARWVLFCWLILRSLVSQRLVLLTRRKKGKIMPLVCLLSAVWPQTYHAGHALSTTRLLKTKRSIILSDVWFEDFFLLVIDVIKPPGTYFNNNIVYRISLIVDLWSSALLSDRTTWKFSSARHQHDTERTQNRAGL